MPAPLSETALVGLSLAKRLHPVAFDPASPYREGHRIGNMCPDRDRGGMIGENSDPHLRVFCPSSHEGAHNILIDALDGLQFFGDISSMARLIRGLDMEIDEVMFLQSFESAPAFAGIIGIEISGGSGDIDDIKTDSPRDSAQQIDRRDQCSVQSEL